MRNGNTIAKSEARKIILNSQMLDGRKRFPKNRETIAGIVEHLGYIQIDTLAVIKRAHHHTLWLRNNHYNESMLHNLQSKDRLVFEYWGHAMSYLPMSDYRFVLPRMRNFLNPKHRWIKRNIELSKHLFEDVLMRIKDEGALTSQDFKNDTDSPRGNWWDWKPAKMALETLYWQGKLMISERQNFQKVYDLTERVLPDWVNVTMPSNEETGVYLVRSALTSLGVASEREIRKFLQPGSGNDVDLRIADAELIKSTIKNLVESGEVKGVRIYDLGSTIYYVLSEKLNTRLRTKDSQIYFLSPFDNLIIQRDRIKDLFDFDYAIECYLPEQKRKFGYFVLPVLFGDKFIARFDVKAERDKGILTVKNLVFENGYCPDDYCLNLFAQKLIAFAEFNRCDSVKIVRCSPSKYRSRLAHAIKGLYSV